MFVILKENLFRLWLRDKYNFLQSHVIIIKENGKSKTIKNYYPFEIEFK
jgi:hypothetical protein